MKRAPPRAACDLTILGARLNGADISEGGWGLVRCVLLLSWHLLSLPTLLEEERLLLRSCRIHTRAKGRVRRQYERVYSRCSF
jgi:hypothetical protein